MDRLIEFYILSVHHSVARNTNKTYDMLPHAVISNQETKKDLRKFTMFFYEHNQIFYKFVDMLNVHFINKIMTKEGQKFKIQKSTKELHSTNYSETAIFFRDILLGQMCEIFNNGFTAKTVCASYTSIIYTVHLSVCCKFR